MSLSQNKKPTQRFQAVDSSIETLQDRLLKSLSTAFDPTTANKSDDFFLAQDYATGNYSEPTSDSFDSAFKNPYKALVDKTKNFVEKSQAERPLRARTAAAAVSSKKSDTFLTGTDMEGNMRKNVVEAPIREEEEAEDPLPQITYGGALGDAAAAEKTDDLEELRKMIRQTKKEMGDYGKELLNLKRDILDVNDFQSKAGFGVNSDLLRNIENTVSSLGQKDMYHYMVKNEGKAKNKAKLEPKTKLAPIKEEGVKKTNMSATTTGPASFIVTRKSFGTGSGVRPSSYKGSLRK